MTETKKQPRAGATELSEKILDKVSAGNFKSVSGLKSESEVVTFKEGGSNRALKS